MVIPTTLYKAEMAKLKRTIFTVDRANPSMLSSRPSWRREYHVTRRREGAGIFNYRYADVALFERSGVVQAVPYHQYSLPEA